MTTKEKIINLLTTESFVSGQKIADELKISRAAVWKSIRALTAEGYNITSRFGKGYTLSENNKLSEAGIKKYIANKSLHKIRIFVYDETDSTNTRAKLFAREHPGTSAIFIADAQTAGRGRMGHSFDSARGAGIYMSFLICENTLLLEPDILTVRAAVKLASAIESECRLSPSIKWVNDLYLSGKKVAGILTEGIFDTESGAMSAAICGIGVNVFKRAFPEEISSIASSLEECGGENISRQRLAAKIIEEFFSPDGSIIDEYRRRSFVLGNSVRVICKSGDYNATAVAITDKGHLIVRTEDGTEKELISGEVSITPAQG